MKVYSYSESNQPAGAAYYPRADGIGSQEKISFQFFGSGDVTFTIEARVGDGTFDWQNITNRFVDASGSSAASYLNPLRELLSATDLYYRQIRVKVDAADSTNSISIDMLVE